MNILSTVKSWFSPKQPEKTVEPQPNVVSPPDKDISPTDLKKAEEPSPVVDSVKDENLPNIPLDLAQDFWNAYSPEQRRQIVAMYKASKHYNPKVLIDPIQFTRFLALNNLIEIK